MFNLINYEHMGRCLARSSESHSISFYFLIICTISYTIFKNFLVHILSIYIMYQVLQVYSSLSFFDNFLSRSIKVGQSSSRRRRLRVAETSPRRCGDVAETSSQLFLNHLVSIRSRRRRRDVAETSRRRLAP